MSLFRELPDPNVAQYKYTLASSRNRTFSRHLEIYPSQVPVSSLALAQLMSAQGQFITFKQIPSTYSSVRCRHYYIRTKPAECFTTWSGSLTLPGFLLEDWTHQMQIFRIYLPKHCESAWPRVAQFAYTDWPERAAEAGKSTGREQSHVHSVPVHHACQCPMVPNVQKHPKID